MALSATIYKADLQISDIDRGYYQSHQLTIAQHPSETTERMMIRVAAFAIHADEQLAFTKGISTDDEPDLWQKNYSDEIEHWIELGQPDEKRIRKACGQARHVTIYCYGDNAAPIWWQAIESKLSRFNNLSVYFLNNTTTQALDGLVERNMQLQATIQDGELWLSSEQGNVTVAPEAWLQQQ